MGEIKVIVLLPMSIRCQTCGIHINKGTKFNARREAVVGEKYLNIQIHRFCFKCTICKSKITIKTDPQISDCIVESGATPVAEASLNETESKRAFVSFKELLANYKHSSIQKDKDQSEGFGGRRGFLILVVTFGCGFLCGFFFA